MKYKHPLGTRASRPRRGRDALRVLSLAPQRSGTRGEYSQGGRANRKGR